MVRAYLPPVVPAGGAATAKTASTVAAAPTPRVVSALQAGYFHQPPLSPLSSTSKTKSGRCTLHLDADPNVSKESSEHFGSPTHYLRAGCWCRCPTCPRNLRARARTCVHISRSRGGQHYSEGIHGPPSGEGHRTSPDIQAPALANQVCVSDSMSGVDDPQSPLPDRQ
jgi:hypothetical protein